MAWKGFKDMKATIEISLIKDEEELWDSLDKDAKWGVKKAKKKGLSIRIGKKEDFSGKELRDFYKIYKITCEYGGIIPQGYGEMMQRDLNYIFCYKNGKLIGGSALFLEKERTRQHLNASNPDYLKFQPNNLIYWKMILWSKENGFKILDLGGYQLGAKKGDKLYNINKFKNRWGGKIEYYPVYSYNLLYILGRKSIKKSRFLKRLNENFKKWKKKQN